MEEEGYWKHYRHMYVAIVGKDDNLLGNWNGNQKTWGIVLFGENGEYGHCCLVLEVVVEEHVCCVNYQPGSGKHLDLWTYPKLLVVGLDYIVLDHANWDSNLATKTHLARTRQIKVKSVTNYDEWFPTICDSLENMSD